MNRLKLILFSLIGVSSGCNNDDDGFQVTDNRNNIIGTQLVTNVVEIRTDTVFRESSFMFDTTFGDGGMGIKESLFGDITIDWLYQSNPEKVAIISDQAGLVLKDTQIYDVVTNEPNRQIWEYEVDDLTGAADVFPNTWKMERKQV